MIAMIVVAVLVVLATLVLLKPTKKRLIALDPNNKVGQVAAAVLISYFVDFLQFDDVLSLLRSG